MLHQPSRIWPLGSVLKILFLGEEKKSRWKDVILQYAEEWVVDVDLVLSFVDPSSTDSHIRIGFEENGCWSVIGTEAMFVPETEATMNFSPSWWSTQHYLNKRQVLHQFGHALGLLHVHSRKQILAQAKKLMKKPRSKHIGCSIDRKVNADFSPSSITVMALIGKKHSVVFSLTQADKEAIALMYPRPRKAKIELDEMTEVSKTIDQ